MTYGKLRMFRRDRLYTSDKERVQGLTDFLKKNRVVDDQFAFLTTPNKS